MDMDTIERTAKSTRTRARRAMNGATKGTAAKAERAGADVVVAMDRAQRSVGDFGRSAQRSMSEFGDRAYSSSRDAVMRVAQEIEARPWTAAALMGGPRFLGPRASPRRGCCYTRGRRIRSCC